ncbi:hypothetical protein K470DRAFT_261804 [Piedraia hortae CBS 480.64]|uniref:Uncharacterized protein n=1 Tax=Piedraia hortae CBS 480.64 TaxID=1314780 RepID=A0A6A7C9Q3_9PEZI|nr:hypothetical protein K470DRAFT_261804 [Piedraia hortae CBS 480.64]
MQFQIICLFIALLAPNTTVGGNVTAADKRVGLTSQVGGGHTTSIARLNITAASTNYSQDGGRNYTIIEGPNVTLTCNDGSLAPAEQTAGMISYINRWHNFTWWGRSNVAGPYGIDTTRVGLRTAVGNESKGG